MSVFLTLEFPESRYQDLFIFVSPVFKHTVGIQWLLKNEWPSVLVLLKIKEWGLFSGMPAQWDSEFVVCVGDAGWWCLFPFISSLPHAEEISMCYRLPSAHMFLGWRHQVLSSFSGAQIGFPRLSRWAYPCKSSSVSKCQVGPRVILPALVIQTSF